MSKINEAKTGDVVTITGVVTKQRGGKGRAEIRWGGGVKWDVVGSVECQIVTPDEVVGTITEGRS